MAKSNPIIAIIVSDRYQRGLDFLRFNGLNPRCFKIATRSQDLRGLDRDIPVIITYYENRDLLYELREAISDHGFTSVRYIEY